MIIPTTILKIVSEEKNLAISMKKLFVVCNIQNTPKKPVTIVINPPKVQKKNTLIKAISEPE